MSKKKYDDDPGHTIVDMNVEGMPGYIKPEVKKNRREIAALNLTKKERRAIFWGGFLAALPVALIIIGSFAAMVLFAYWWLK
ncbi:MAG: hypothetical protein FWE84_03850 [Firmicutes bacterium]|nr:hypothetical protein [Bacillota bacterium]